MAAPDGVKGKWKNRPGDHAVIREESMEYRPSMRGHARRHVPVPGIGPGGRPRPRVNQEKRITGGDPAVPSHGPGRPGKGGAPCAAARAFTGRGAWCQAWVWPASWETPDSARALRWRDAAMRATPPPSTTIAARAIRAMPAPVWARVLAMLWR